MVDVGAVATQPSAGATSVPVDSHWKKFGLWAVLLLCVVFLVAMAFSLLRKPSVKS
ncbi:hypothetical protein D3C76_1851460 [compost metagenome]